MLDVKNWVYENLEDEESKFIWKEKTAFNEDRDYGHIKAIVDKYMPNIRRYGIYQHGYEERRILNEIRDKGKNIIIYGAGFQGKRLLQICKEMSIDITCFCDSSKDKWNSCIEGKEIRSLDVVLKAYGIGQYAFIISPEAVDIEIKENLILHGVAEEDIYLYSKEYIESKEQYFDENIIKLSHDEIFVDGGCFDFATSNLLVKKMKEENKSIKKIYAFEPDNINYNKCAKKIGEMNLSNVELTDAGLWNENTYLEFVMEGSAGSKIIQSEIPGANKVKVVALDSIIDEPITFIKFDIEGAEFNALKGAEKLISAYKPKLAICVYHKNEDMWEIPYYIKQLVPEYKLYIRHYSNCSLETVLYAVV